jgi:signal transduction histidine kinase
MQRYIAQFAVVRYGVAVLSVTIAVVVAFWLRPVVLGGAQLLLLAILITGWVSRLRPALVAWVLALLAFDYYFTPPFDSVKIEVTEIPRPVLFMLVAGFMATMERGTTPGREFPAAGPEWFSTALGCRYFAVSYSPLRPDSERVEAALVIGRDLTEHMLASEALHQAQAELAHITRLTTLGELAASIAHEVNQPLTAIVADAHASLNWSAAANPNLDMVRDALKAIVKDGHRAADVIQRIRQLATKTGPPKAALDVNDVIRDVVALVCTEVLSQHVSLRVDLAPALAPVLADRVQLQQVIINLLLNGIEAMVTVSDRPRELVIRSEPQDANEVRVAVQDDGIGIDANSVDQLFDAFFSTKPGGMGMGLSISRSIIEGHGGRLWATPNANHGATFYFALPGLR